MRKILLAGVAMVMATGTAMADSITTNVEATVAPSCTVTHTGSSTVSIATGQQGIGSYAYKCNNVTGFSRKIKSANGGQLRRNGTETTPGHFVPYSFDHLAAGALAAVVSESLPNSLTTFGSVGTSDAATFLGAGQSGAASITLDTATVNAGVFEGSYTDVITVEITASP